MNMRNVYCQRLVLMVSVSFHAKEGVTRYAKHWKGMLGNIKEC